MVGTPLLPLLKNIISYKVKEEELSTEVSIILFFIDSLTCDSFLDLFLLFEFIFIFTGELKFMYKDELE